MDMFNLCTGPCRRVYSHLTKHIKSPQAGIVHCIRLAEGLWEHELLEIISDSLLDTSKLDILGSGGSQMVCLREGQGSRLFMPLPVWHL